MVGELDTPSSVPKDESNNTNSEAVEVDNGNIINGSPMFLSVRCKPDRQTVFTFHR